jgi:hypothetical protein
MNYVAYSDAMLFPANGSLPHLVPLMSTTFALNGVTTGTPLRVPYPQIHMNGVAIDAPYLVWESRVGDLCQFNPLTFT